MMSEGFILNAEFFEDIKSEDVETLHCTIRVMDENNGDGFDNVVWLASITNEVSNESLLFNSNGLDALIEALQDIRKRYETE